MSKHFKKLSHSIYECKYHIVFCPKYRYRIFEDEIAEYTQQQIYKYCSYKELVEVLELNIQVDHVHVGFVNSAEIYSVFYCGFLKGSNSNPAVSKI